MLNLNKRKIMKKMFFAAAFLTVATVGTTFAQDATSADNNTAAVEQVVVEFVDVDIDTLPAAVMEAVATIDREARITKAQAKEQDGAKIYKLTLTAADGTTQELCFDENGNRIEPEKA